MTNKKQALNGLKIDQGTLESLYNFISLNYERLNNYYNTVLPKKEREKIPFTLFCISVFSVEHS